MGPPGTLWVVGKTHEWAYGVWMRLGFVEFGAF